VRPELGALAGIEGTFKERAEDGRLHTRPIKPAGLGQRAQLVRGQGHDRDLGKQAAVEAVEGNRAEVTAIAHRSQQRLGPRCEAVRLAHRAGQQVCKESFRQ
jgi:hypothetical protein